MKKTTNQKKKPWQKRQLAKAERAMEGFIFFSRWFQAPIYIGLMVALFFYVIHFLKELLHLIERIMTSELSELDVMLTVLTMVDAVLISNLLIIVIIGGWDTFVSRLDLDKEKDYPDWLSHVSAWVLKAKLAAAIVSITSVHLLTSFMRADEVSDRTLFWQTVVHVVLMASAVTMAYIARSAMGHKTK